MFWQPNFRPVDQEPVKVFAGGRFRRRPRSLRQMVPKNRGSAVILDDVYGFDRIFSAG